MKKIVYFQKEDLLSFLNATEQQVIGIANEWEGENVIHFHLQPPRHSYGNKMNVLYVKEISDINSLSTYNYVVCIEGNIANFNVSLFNHELKLCEDIQIEFIPSKTELYSRNKGILEIGILEHKRVMIVGLGSFGSQIAIELAKAGVGEFALFDFDRVELHNLARHTSTVNDLGRLKTDVIFEAIKGKNPYAKVDLFPINVNQYTDLMNEQVRKADLVICATDNNKSRFNLSQTLVRQQTIGIFGRAVTRAEGGDVFRYRPGGPCYCCLIGNQWFGQTQEEITSASNSNIPAYASAEQADAMVQVGLSADIEPICNMMVKISLMELSRGCQSGITCLEQELVYDYYLWANRRERRHRNWAPMPNSGARPTIMRWYGARIERNEECALCSNIMPELDEGDTIVKKYGLEVGNLDGITIEE